jgi:hypothetical protein
MGFWPDTNTYVSILITVYEIYYEDWEEAGLVATGWMAEGSEFEFWQGKIFLLSTSSSWVLGPTSPPIQ